MVDKENNAIPIKIMVRDPKAESNAPLYTDFFAHISGEAKVGTFTSDVSSGKFIDELMKAWPASLKKVDATQFFEKAGAVKSEEERS